MFKSDVSTVYYAGETGPGFCFGTLNEIFISPNSDLGKLNRTHLITAASEVMLI
jgi:hypothetical protein